LLVLHFLRSRAWFGATFASSLAARSLVIRTAAANHSTFIN